MLYRVLCFAVISATSAHAAAVAPPEHGASLADELPLAELLYGFRYTAEDAPHPMNAADGNLMWDASGLGCVDGGGWDDPFPGAKGDPRNPVFCIPQPCAGLLTPEDLSREVYGRPLRDGEYQTYLDRLEQTCGELPEPATDRASRDLEEYLRLASLRFEPASFDAGYPFASPLTPGRGPAVEEGPRHFGAMTPVDLRVDLGPSGRRDVRTSASRYSPAWGADGWSGGSARSDGRPRRDGQPGPSAGGPPLAPDLSDPLAPITGGPNGPLPPDHPTPPAGPGGGDPVQPAPVPVAGGLPFLLTALATLIAGRVGQRRRSRRELMG